MSVSRDTFFRQFGPLDQEALHLVLMDYFNLLREEQGMPPITEQEFLNDCQAKLDTLPPYDWMKDTP